MDDLSLRVIHPGFASVEGGPDFRDAIIQIGEDPPQTGDVEIDLQSSGWHAHGHDKNPNFKNVILHVIWEAASPTKISLPTLALRDFLDAPLTELRAMLGNESLRSLPESLRGKCCAPLRELDSHKLGELLNQAALVRLEMKAEQFRVAARNEGWQQALWEGLFRALGYKHNIWPMQRLAEIKTHWMDGTMSPFELQTRLLGISGLLPDELTRSQKSSDTFLRRTWDGWWRERDGFAEFILPRQAWRFHGLRPANHPQRRLALAAHWLTDEKFISKIEDWATTKISDARLLDSLLEILQIRDDPFWSWHYTLKSARLKKPLPLLGEMRATDLAINVILPWLWLRATAGKNESLQKEMERRFFAWPTAEDNSVLKLARQRLLGTANARLLKTAAQQQGLLQIVRDFCGHSDAVCADCHFPELARSWNATVI